MRVIIAMLVLALSAACSTNSLSTKMASWQGSHIDEISSVWGSPDDCAKRAGRELCTWSTAAAGQISASNSDNAKDRPICVRTIEVDESGLIIGWRWRGDRCSNTAAEVLAKTTAERPEILAANKKSATLELAVIEPMEQPVISRTQ